MSMIEVKTSELIGAALDWAVAWIEGDKVSVEDGYVVVAEFNEQHGDFFNVCYSPSADWSQGGPLIEKHKVIIAYHNAPDRMPVATTIETNPDYEFGATPLIAAMRAIVAAKLGDVVSVPSELAGRAK